ncbi:MAG TPA: multidrug efflux RND transporter permease subunit [Candidatus Krumholzibacteria bacterium]|nr:multidrug efflux RND transporter permease subunit [Candidatus Krumholzibacteria bacterium]
MAEFFIRRPIVAIVISIVMVLVGVATLQKLSIEQYPELSPPTIRVETTYPGASAEVVEQSVATPIEQQVNGVDNMIYMKSLNTSDGRMLLDVTFQVGMNRDMANVLTQNRVSQAQPRLAQEVLQQGVTVKKINPSILLVCALFSPNGTYDSQWLNNYAMINIRDAMLRIQGVASVDLYGGAEYGMRVWLRPDEMAKLGLTPADVIGAIREQNLQAPAGQIGAAPSPPGQEATYTVRAPGRLVTPEEFENIIVRSTKTGALVRIRDIGRVELGSENYRSFGRVNGKPAGTLVVYLLPGANQLKAAHGLYTTLEELKGFFPPDVDYKITYDTTPAVEASIHEIKKTFVEALALVTLVVFIFLQSLRATIIPLLTVPVCLIGTFIFFPMLGFSVNTLSMFGLILAIGIVVDDAIVVVEAVMHHIEHGMSPRDATSKAMKEVTSPVVAIAFILCAVFVPVALLGGLTGSLYRQFALTIAISVLLSAFNALTLSPALSAMLLKPSKGARKGPLGWFFRGFNSFFDRTTNGYVNWSRLFVRRAILAVGVVVVAGLGAGGLGKILPKGFVPDEDQGIFMINAQLPLASSLQRTDAVMRKVEDLLAHTEGVESYSSIGGLGMLTNSFSAEFGSIFVRLKPWDERKSHELHVKGIMAHLRPELGAIPEALVFSFLPPTIPGFGAAGGFNFMLQDRSGTLTPQELGANVQRFVEEGRKRPELANLFTSFNPNTPQVDVKLDREKARTLGVPVNDVFAALQAVLGGAYVNDFNRFGRLYRVYLQSDAPYRQKPEDIGQFYVRSVTTGDMIPLSTLVTVGPTSGPETMVRFNLFRTAEITGAQAPGYSSGQAMVALEEVAAQVLPKEMGTSYSGFSYQEKVAPPSAPTFILAVVFVFLLLAALYESWKLPWAVLLETPLVAIGAYFGVWLRGYDNNVYVQVGLIMLIGLAAKNAILIVEFARSRRNEGADIETAALDAAKLRFRPILMTAFAFIMGCIPLMLAHSAGAGSMSVMGTSVVVGMLVATAVGVFIVPGLFALMERLGRKKAEAPEGQAALAGAPAAATAPTHGAH